MQDEILKIRKVGGPYEISVAIDRHCIFEKNLYFLRPACVLELANTSTDSQSVTSGVLIMRKLWKRVDRATHRKLPDFLFRNRVAAATGAS